MTVDWIIGADEVGYGSWAGPLVVCAAIVPEGWTLEGLNDSKKLSPKKRAKLYEQLQDAFPFVRTFVDWTWPSDIDRLGVGRARVESFRRVVVAAEKVEPSARIILDGDLKLHGIIHESFPKADGLVPAVMAASVFAKVERDRWMETEADSEHPEYKFHANKGYGTRDHLIALDTYGPCPLHRMSYEPVFKRAGVIG